MAERPQLSLFQTGGAVPNPTGPQAVVTSAQRELAARLPSNVYLGTSSWTFTGWSGVLYAGRPSKNALVERGLEAYARHPLLRTVGVDRSYWAPMSRDDWRRYAMQLPADFVTTTKAWSELTTAVFADHPKMGDRAGKANAQFLDPDLAMNDVVRPYLEGMGERCGPLILELAPIPERFLDEDAQLRLHQKMARLFASLPRELSVAIELRNVKLLTPRYLDLLATHRVGHVISFWSGMPTPAQQAALGADRLPGDLTFRLLQPPGSSYDALAAAFEPFDEVKAPQPRLIDDVAEITRRALAQQRRVFVIVGNKAEGCAPQTVFSLAARIAGDTTGSSE